MMLVGVAQGQDAIEVCEGVDCLLPHILALPADLANNSCSINDSLVDDGG
jgi:hypothetical protein